jgi:hypothetical protein
MNAGSNSGPSYGKWWVVATVVVVLIAAVNVVVRLPARPGHDNSPKPPAVPLNVLEDSTAVRLMERMFAQRASMSAVLGRERELDRQLDRASDLGGSVPQSAVSSSDKRRYDSFDAIADSCSERLCKSILGLAPPQATDVPQRLSALFPRRQSTMMWATASSEPHVQFGLFINYACRASSAELPSAQAAKMDIASAAFQAVPRFFSIYPRLEYVELHEYSAGWVIATLGLSRNQWEKLSQSKDLGSNLDTYASLVELNAALIMSGKLR